MSFQGIEFTPEMRKMVVNAKHFFDNLKKSSTTIKVPATELTAKALGISVSTVKVIMAVYNKKGEAGLNWSNFQERYKSPWGMYTP